MFGGQLKSKSEEEKCNYVMLWAGEKGAILILLGHLQMKKENNWQFTMKNLKINVNLNPTKSTPDIFACEESKEQMNHLNNL